MPGLSTTNWPLDRAAHEARKYWSDRLKSVSFDQHIPLDHPRPPDGRPEYRVLDLRLRDETWRDLERLTGGKPFLAFTALLLATKLACRQYSGNPDVTVLCSSVAVAVADGAAQSQLPIHSVLDPEAAFKQALRATRELLAEAFRHDRLPFARLMIDLPPERRPDRAPLVLSMAGLTGDSLDVDADVAIRFSAGNAAATVRFDARLFAEVTVTHFLRLVDRVLSTGVRDPNRPIADLAPELPAPEPAATGALIHERVAERAAKHPERVAIVEGPRVTTYGELERHASELAHRLSAAGLEPRTTVAVLLPSGTDMAVAVDAVWKAGGLVAPLRPLATARPIEQTLQALGCTSVICPVEDVARIRDVCGATAVRSAFVAEYSDATSEYELEHFAVGGAAKCDAEPRADLACVFAVGASRAAVTHADVLSAFDHVNAQADIGAHDRCLFSPGMGACEQLYDTFGMLLAGASVEIWNDPVTGEPATLLQRLRSERVTVWDLPAGLVLNLLPQLGGAPRVVLLTGEKQSATLADQLRTRLGTRVVGLYAPPGLGVWTTVFDLAAQAVGRPVPGFAHRIVTAGGTTAPVLGKGELRLDTASGPVVTGMRVQRLKDSGLRWLRGEDHRCGRAGCDVELTTLEEILCEQDGIRAAEVRAVKGNVVAFVLGDVGDEAALRARLAADRRVDVVPDRFETLEELPLQADGAIDGVALTKDLAAVGGEVDTDGRARLESAVRRLWSESLEVETIDEDESFFVAGGNSLKATMLIDRIRKEFGVQVSVQRFFREPTARAMAALVAAESGNGVVEEPGAGFGPVSREQYRRVLQRTEPAAGGQ